MQQYCPNFSNKQVKAEFDELVDIFGEDYAYFLWDKNQGYSLDRTPFGESSELFLSFLDASNGDRRKAMLLTANSMLEDSNTSSEEDMFSSYFNIPEKTSMDVENNLISEGVILKFKGLRLSKEDKESIDRINEECEGSDVVPIFTNHQNSTTVDFIDGVYFSEGLKDEILKSNDKDFLDITNVVSKLKEKMPGTKAFVIRPSEIPKGIDKTANSFVIGNNIYLVHERVTTENTVEEFMHPIVYTIYNTHYSWFKDLLGQAEKDFPVLCAEIRNTYTDKKGFDTSYRENEIVTQALTRYVHHNFATANDKHSVKKLIDGMFNYISHLFYAVAEKVGKFYKFDAAKLPKMKLRELADFISADDVQIQVYTQEDINYHISNLVDRQRRVAEKLTERFGILYNAYKKMPNKSKRRELIQDAIFDTYNKLQLHQDASAIRIALNFALSTIGLLDRTGLNATTDDCILSYLIKQSKLDDPYSGMDATTLVEMLLNSIGFYSNLYEEYLKKDGFQMVFDDKDTKRFDQLNRSINKAKFLWAQAMLVVGDRQVDDFTDRWYKADKKSIEDAKTVAKNFLHTNTMYGDVSSPVAYLSNAAYSENPIIRQGFHLIQEAETKTLEELQPISKKLLKLFDKANKPFKKLKLMNWQTMFWEKNKDGIPTGNIITKVNKGQYDEDLELFVKQLNERWLKDYGYTYITDKNGTVYNSRDKSLAEDEEWDDDPNSEPPLYIQYLLEIEKFKTGKNGSKGPRANKRFTFEYYKERMSRPYRGIVDPEDLPIDGINHGLSPKTLARYNYIINNINYYLAKAKDPETGIIYPERLEPEYKAKYDLWQTKLDNLSNPYNYDGTPKKDEERQTAFEIRAWQKWIESQLETEIDLDAFEKQLAEYVEEAKTTGDNTKLNDFIRYNSRVGINPDYIKQTIGKYDRDDKNPKSIHARMIKSSLLNLVKTSDGYTRDLGKMENNILFWQHCKFVDLLIEDSKILADPEFALVYSNSFENKDILYADAYGNYIIKSTGETISPDKINEFNLHLLYTFRDYMIDKYTDIVMNNPSRTIPGINDRNGKPIVFNGDRTDVYMLVLKLFSYKKTLHKKDGSIEIVNAPLTIFLMMMPATDTFVNERTGRTEKTILLVPKGRFSKRNNKWFAKYINEDFDETNPNAEQPNINYVDEEGDRRYDNSKEFSEIEKDKNIKELYDAIIETLTNAQKIYSTGNNFNYRLPLINTTAMLILSRVGKNGFKKVLSQMATAILNAEATDEGMRMEEDFITNPDGTVATDVPLKYIRKLKDPSRLTSDIVGSTIIFANMALNYKNKSAIDAQLKTYLYNLDSEYRDLVEYGPDEVKPLSGKNSYKQYKAILNNLVYENQWNSDPQEGPLSSKKVMAVEAAKLFKRVGSVHLLGWNFNSIEVGFLDSIRRLIQDAIGGRYCTLLDLITSFAYCIIKTPLCIANIGNPAPNNKLAYAMRLNGISKGSIEAHRNLNRGRFVRFADQLTMGGYSMTDWMANALLLRSYYNNIRLYKGGVVPTGFYSLYELELAFNNAGHSTKEAILAHTMSTTTLWGAYNNKMELKPEFSDETHPNFICHVSQDTKTTLRTKTILRAALANGINPQNDITMFQNNPAGALILSMRGWVQQSAQHLLSGGVDNIVRTTHTDELFNVKREKTLFGKKIVRDKVSDEDRARQMSFNYETGLPQDLIYRAIGWSFKTLFRKLYKLITLRFAEAGNIKFSKAEKFAWRSVLIFLAMLATFLVCWIPINEEQLKIEPPKTKEASGADWYDPVSVYNYMNDYYIGQEYYKITMANVGFRTIESMIASADPTTTMDFLTSISTLTSAVNDAGVVFTSTADLIGLSGHDPDEIIKQGGFKYYTREERDLYKITGFGKNLNSSFGYYGQKSNMNFYTNKYGKVYRTVGYDFKHEEEKSSKNKIKSTKLRRNSLKSNKPKSNKLK